MPSANCAKYASSFDGGNAFMASMQAWLSVSDVFGLEPLQPTRSSAQIIIGSIFITVSYRLTDNRRLGLQPIKGQVWPIRFHESDFIHGSVACPESIGASGLKRCAMRLGGLVAHYAACMVASRFVESEKLLGERLADGDGEIRARNDLGIRHRAPIRRCQKHGGFQIPASGVGRPE